MEDINKLKINFACQLNHSSDYDTVRQLCETYSYENHSIWRTKTGKLKWLLVSRRSFAASVGFLAMVIPGYPQVSLFRFFICISSGYISSSISSSHSSPHSSQVHFETGF